jgi:secreted trypsin-like serine protease
VIGLLVSVANAGPLPPPIVGGSETTAWPAVALLVGYDGDTIVPFCSAVLIGDRWALTAAHCLLDSGADLQSAGFELWFRVGPSVFEAPTEFLRIATGTTDPDYGDGPLGRGHDAAVLELESALDTAPLEISPNATDTSLVDSTITYVGYGLTGTLETDPGIARTVDARVSNVDAWVIETADPNHGPCDGDSGGPLLLDGQVIGLSSYVYTTGSASDLCEHGTAAGTRIDIVRDWIASIVVEKPDDTGEPKDSGKPKGPDDSGPKDSGATDSDPPAEAPDDGADPAEAQLGCACGTARHGSGLAALAMVAFASRRRRSGVCRA